MAVAAIYSSPEQGHNFLKYWESSFTHQKVVIVLKRSIKRTGKCAILPLLSLLVVPIGQLAFFLF